MNKPNKPVVEERFNYNGFSCVVLFQPMGYRTGYVGLPKEHKYYKKEYDELPIDCHCGLTYSREYLYGQDDKEVWWIGFDCGHICDSRDIDSVRKYYGNEMADKILNDFYYLTDYAVERDIDYVKKECIGIVNQLLKESEE